MRILVTGASGWVGTPVTQDLLKHGHEVLGLARSKESAAKMEQSGVIPISGNIEDLQSLRKATDNVDGVLHLAFNHDFSQFAQNAENDSAAIRTLAEVLGKRPLIITSGTAILESGESADESLRVSRTSPYPRKASEIAMEDMLEKGCNVSVVRLPPSVHGKGDYGFVPLLIGIARDKGCAAYIGDGSNSWAAVSRFDAAPVYRLALERGVAGARYHAVAEEGVPFKAIAEKIAEGLNIPLISLAPEKASDYYGWFSHFASLDNRTTSAWTRETLGWTPTHPTLFEDMKNYF